MKIDNTFKLIILVIIGFVIFQAGVFVYFKSTDMDNAKKSELPSFSKANEVNNKEANNELDVGVSKKQSCTSNKKPVFTHHITDISKINYVVPPPTIGAGPSLKTHGYIGTDHIRVPVYAPTDMVLNTGAHFEGGPYWIGFEVSCVK